MINNLHNITEDIFILMVHCSGQRIEVDTGWGVLSKRFRSTVAMQRVGQNQKCGVSFSFMVTE